jgi:hypothetical protein
MDRLNQIPVNAKAAPPCGSYAGGLCLAAATILTGIGLLRRAPAPG